MWEVYYTDEFWVWWDSLTEREQDAVDYSVELLENYGPDLKFPHTSLVEQSRHRKMRELRSQCEGRPLRTFYMFDPYRKSDIADWRRKNR